MSGDRENTTTTVSQLNLEEVEPPPKSPWTLRALAVASVLVISFAVVYGTPAVPELLSKQTAGSYEVPEGSPSLVATQRQLDSFPQLTQMVKTSVLVVVQALPGTKTVLTPAVDRFSSNITHRALQDPRTKLLGPVGAGYYLPNWFMDMHKKDPILKAGFVSPDERTTIIVFMARKEPPKTANLTTQEVTRNVVEFLQEHAAYPPAGCKVLLTGDPIVHFDLLHDRSIEAMLRGELIVLPIAMMVLVWLIRDLRLLLIPPITLVVAFMISAALVLKAADFLPAYSADVPPAMVSVCIALTLDFNLFFLTRFSNNLNMNMPLQENIENMVAYTGHTVWISGSLIFVAFCGAVLIPQHNLATAGLCLGITTAVCIVVCTTIPPTMLFYFSRLFTRPCCEGQRNVSLDLERINYTAPESPEQSPRSPEESRAWDLSPRTVLIEAVDVEHDANSLLFDLNRRDLEDLTLEAAADSSCGLPSSGSGFWLWLMRIVERHPGTAIVMVLLLFSPLLVAPLYLHQTSDIYSMLPTTLPAVRALREIQAAGIPVGRFEPYFLIISKRQVEEDVDMAHSLPLPGKKKSAVLTPYTFGAMSQLVTSVQEVGNLAGVLGPTHLVDTAVDWHFAEALVSSNMSTIKKLAPAGSNAFQLHRLFGIVLAMQVKERYAAIQLHTWTPPRGAGSADFVLAVRERLAAWEAAYPDLVVTLSGGAVGLADLRESVRPSIPRYVALTTVVVMLVVFCMFRSLLLPLRLAFALVFTVLATFGATVFVYQTPLFHWLSPDLKNFDGLNYASIPQTLCIAIALGIDYDIFLVSRIFEYRRLGFTDREGIVYGVAKTGSIISGAALIMALAFSGLMMSPKLMLQQFGFVLIVSVLLDAFVVRTVLVPALMLSAGDWNWWPRRMKPVRNAGLLLPPDCSDLKQYRAGRTAAMPPL
eukprot:TRINITY_DN120695_c0_g1_i1.p1 TRINITY_DN120695_c0_g1~~TRINITY_DN120695_c0_g1_i1.p1  ORF type:complete len:930 (-),score=118.60 TRINITY_DN120695_c0_g1_i1:83-2872(-)